MGQLVISKNNLFFYFLIFGYLFGVIFYDYLKFDFTDELMAFFLVLFAGITVYERKDIKQLKPLFYLGLVFLFYTIYSFAIHSNVPQAILKDFVIQIKPFLGFFCAWLIAPQFTKKQRLFACILCMLIGCFIVIVYMSGNMWTFFVHPSRLATSATVTALLFLYCCSFTWSEIVIFIILLSVGILSTRSKLYGFWCVSLLLIVYYKLGGFIKLDLKTVLGILVVFSLVIFLTWEKIAIYYISGYLNSKEMWSKPAMMVTAFLILYDYFPFGSGLGSFGTYASGEYYSSIYEKYGIDRLWGITRENPMFIADAYYPELAQFGIVGVIIYFGFWIWIVKRGLIIQTVSKQSALIIILVFLFFLIEGTSDATLTHNRGLFIMILLGIVMGQSDKQLR